MLCWSQLKPMGMRSSTALMCCGNRKRPARRQPAAQHQVRSARKRISARKSIARKTPTRCARGWCPRACRKAGEKTGWGFCCCCCLGLWGYTEPPAGGGTPVGNYSKTAKRHRQHLPSSGLPVLEMLNDTLCRLPPSSPSLGDLALAARTCFCSKRSPVPNAAELQRPLVWTEARRSLTVWPSSHRSSPAVTHHNGTRTQDHRKVSFPMTS